MKKIDPVYSSMMPRRPERWNEDDTEADDRVRNASRKDEAENRRLILLCVPTLLVSDG